MFLATASVLSLVSALGKIPATIPVLVMATVRLRQAPPSKHIHRSRADPRCAGLRPVAGRGRLGQALPHVTIFPSDFLTCPPQNMALMGLLYPHEQLQLLKSGAFSITAMMRTCGTFSRREVRSCEVVESGWGVGTAWTRW